LPCLGHPVVLHVMVDLHLLIRRYRVASKNWHHFCTS